MKYEQLMEELERKIDEATEQLNAAQELGEVRRCGEALKELTERREEARDRHVRDLEARILNGGADCDSWRAENAVVIERSDGLTAGTTNNSLEIRKMDNDSLEMRSFQKFLQNGGKMAALTDAEQRALDISGSAAVLPKEIWNELITGEAYSDLLQRATVFEESNAGTLSIPIASNTSASWKIENSSVDGSSNTYEASPTLTNLNLGGYELYRWMRVSAATMSRSSSNFTDMMLRLLSSEAIEAIEAAFVSGSGSGEPKGLDELTWVPDTNQILTATAATPIAAADIAEALSLLPQKYARNAILLVNSDMAFNMSQFKGTTEYAYSLADGATKFLGKEIVISEHVADDTVYIVDPKELYVRFSMPLALEVDRSSGFTSASYDLRALAVVDAAWNPAACVAVGLGAS